MRLVMPPVEPGEDLLDDLDLFVSRFVSYPSVAARTAHVLWIGHTWLMDEWDSTPRIAFLSPEPGSGKSRALEVTESVVPRPVHAVNTTPAYLIRKIDDPDGRPTILYDEIDTVFGPKAKEHEDVRGLLNAGHRRGATSGRCVRRGDAIETEEFPAYCAVAFAGLNDLPDTLMTRSVIVRMRRRRPDERIEPWRLRLNGSEGEVLADRLERWAATRASAVRPLAPHDFPPGIEDRNADVWEALLSVADVAGGRWPARARAAAVTLVTAAQEEGTSLGIELLRDVRQIMIDTGLDRIPSRLLVEELKALEDRPWADLEGRGLDTRRLSRLLRQYSVSSKPVRFDAGVAKGYQIEDLQDPFSRYLPPLS